MEENFADSIEIIELKKATITRSGSPWDWQKGYPEECWEVLRKIENCKFIENSEVIGFRSLDGDEIGIGYLKEGFLYERKRDFVSYWAPGCPKIVKRLDNLGIFEVTDRVGNYCKLRITPVFKDVEFKEHVLYTQILAKKQLLLLSDGFINDWFVPRHSIGESYIKKLSDNEYKMFFESISLLRSKLGGYKFSGVISYGGEHHNWLEIIDLLDSVKEERGLSMDYIEKLEIYNHNNYVQ